MLISQRFVGTLPPIIMVPWRMGPSKTIVSFTIGPFFTSMIMEGRVKVQRFFVQIESVALSP